jgi:hypothetical protein
MVDPMPRFCGKARAALLVIGGLCGLPAVAPALDAPRAAPSASLDRFFVDCRLTVFARHAIQSDPVLASLNVGVTVQDRVALLWGSIPSVEMARRSEALIRKVSGIAGIRNNLRIETTDPLTKELVKSLSPGKPQLPGGEKPGTTMTLTTAPAWGPPANSPVVVSLRPPVSVDPKAPSRAGEVNRAIDQLRASDARFRPIRTELDGNLVRVMPGDTPAENVYAFARMLARVPGVERVVVVTERAAGLTGLHLP